VFEIAGSPMTESDLETKAADVSGEPTEDAGALYILGTRYSIGRDVEQDLIAAHKWFNLAAMMGHEEARISRAELAREMSSSDIAEAQRQARAWLWNRGRNKAAEEGTAQPAASLTSEAKTSPVGHHDWQGNGRSLCA
jgi:uncharacterized protein